MAHPVEHEGHEMIREVRVSEASKEPMNVLGTALEVCGCRPMTGWFRDGTCRTDARDRGRHVICARVTAAFLEFSRSRGNDLTTPMPAHGFPGLEDGDRWCLCAARWVEAWQAGCAPPVVLEATEASALEVVALATLKAHAFAH